MPRKKCTPKRYDRDVTQLPKRFRGTFDNTVYLLTYVNGATDKVVGVRVREANDEPGLPVIEICYPYSHGSGLLIGRILHETDIEIVFEVENPQIDLLDGVVTLAKTAQVWSGGEDL